MRKNSSGFTLIEVLIAMVVVAFALLGFAGLQASALKNNNSSYYRGQAVQLTSNIIEAMRANSVGVAAGVYISELPNGTQTACTTLAPCTSAVLASNDIYDWQLSVGSVIPMGLGTITQAGSAYNISIRWDDNHDGVLNTSDPNFKTDFIP